MRESNKLKSDCKVLGINQKKIQAHYIQRKNTTVHSFLSEAAKLDPKLTVLKIFMIFRIYCS